MKTKTKFPNGMKKVGSRCLRVLALVCEERTVREDLIGLILGMPPSELAKVMKSLEANGLVARERFLVKEASPWVWPTRAGLALDGRDYPHYLPVVGQFGHLAGVAATRAVCVKTDPDALWVSERMLMREHGRCHRHLADGALQVGRKRLAIEVELTSKDRHKVRANMEALLECFAGARYYCSPQTRAAVELAIIERGFKFVEVLDAPACG